MEGRYYAVRIMKHTDEKGALKIYEKQIKEREHRRRRRGLAVIYGLMF